MKKESEKYALLSAPSGRELKKTDSCWLWVGSTHSFGYGEFRIGRKLIRAHKFSYELHNKPIPHGFSVCHHCDQPRCVNPDHLFPGTQADNVKDMAQKGRAGKKLSSHAIPEILRLLEDHTQTDVARMYNVSQNAISHIALGKNWKHLTTMIQRRL